ncbi:hypothetical protein LguiB_011833 [Lonicera macranthoides]
MFYICEPSQLTCDANMDMPYMGQVYAQLLRSFVLDCNRHTIILNLPETHPSCNHCIRTPVLV